MTYPRQCAVCGAWVNFTDVHRHLRGPFEISGCHCDGRRPSRLEFGWPDAKGDRLA